jgi:hypothetical protein
LKVSYFDFLFIYFIAHSVRLIAIYVSPNYCSVSERGFDEPGREMKSRGWRWGFGYAHRNLMGKPLVEGHVNTEK